MRIEATAMVAAFQNHLQQQLDEIRAAGTYKHERVITSPQDARVRVGDGPPVLNLCANNYLGLARHPEGGQAAHEALDRWASGPSSVRFICGTKSTPKPPEPGPTAFPAAKATISNSSR